MFGVVASLVERIVMSEISVLSGICARDVRTFVRTTLLGFRALRKVGAVCVYIIIAIYIIPLGVVTGVVVCRSFNGSLS